MRLKDNYIFYGIFLLAAILRFYDYGSIPFTHDEFSAIFRTKFTNFQDLINLGVKVDGHPALIQVFLYYYGHFFGFEEWVIKLPFTLAGLASLWLFYKTAASWFNSTVALTSTAFLATMQYMVMYSQIARPYISGLFFVLLLFYFWTELIKNQDKKLIINLIGLILSIDLCAYNHHFSLILAALISISGFLFLNPSVKKKYLYALLLSVVLYLPHLPILVYQLHTGGVGGWLSKPHNNFIIKYIEYIFHFSWPVYLVAFALITFSVFNQVNFNKKAWLAFLSWFAIPFVVGFLYSRFVNPVLQFSVLIFGFPFLLMFIFGKLKQQKPTTNLILVAFICCVNIFTLILNRQHYTLFYQSKYEAFIHDYKDLVSRDLDKNIPLLVDSHRPITNYFCEKFQFDSTKIIWFDKFESTHHFEQFLGELAKKSNSLFFSANFSNAPNTIPIIQQYFPSYTQFNHYGVTCYFFQRGTIVNETTLGWLDFDSEVEAPFEQVNERNIVSIDSSDHQYQLDSTTEWSPTFSIDLKPFLKHQNHFIDVSAKLKTAQPDSNVLLVATLEINGENIYWNAIKMSDYNNDSTGFTTAIHSIKLSDIYLKNNSVKLKAFVWNKAHQEVLMDDFSIVLREGNPVLYGLFNEIK
ncbi:MAG: glycosyltransferase family 39 protein [Flavobacteriales bacterium]|nr:glycosyltransferase family 39 protein [Flavobacteriales bacterium]